METTQTRRAGRSVRFSAGDQVMVSFLARTRWCLAEDLAIAVGRSTAKVRQRLSALRKAGFVDYDRPTGPAAWRATYRGLATACLGGPPAKPIRPGGFVHATTLASLAAAFEEAGLSYLTEHELRRGLAEETDEKQRLRYAATWNSRWRVPDLRVDLPSASVAVELELHAKAAGRWREVLTAHARAEWRVLYLCPPEVERALGKTVETKLAKGRKEDLRLRVLPAPIMSPDDGRLERPDPQAAAEIADWLLERAMQDREEM